MASTANPHVATQAGKDAALDQEVVKADHQKADDAAVPVHLWYSMFMKAQAADQKVQHLLAERWQEGLALFQETHLPLWRSRCLKSWVDFSKTYIPQSEEKTHGTHLSWVVVPPVERRGSLWHKKIKKAM